MRMFASTLALMDQGAGALDEATRVADATPDATRPEVMRLIMEQGYTLEYDPINAEFYIKMSEPMPRVTIERMLAFIRNVNGMDGVK
jgi:hypothetical protein